MRKQTKYVAVLSAAALLAMGASMTSFAAGWEKDEAGAWHYYDKDDDMVTNEWKKDGGKWFYLDDDGNMVSNQWVEDDYYVGEDGAMITNGWVKTLADDEDVDSPEDTGEHWYYFDGKGKKVTSSSNNNGKKTIHGKTYFFDDEGRMLTGWHIFNETTDANGKVDGDVYYLGSEDEGWAAKSQWLWLEKSGLADDDDDDTTVSQRVLGCIDSEDDTCDDEGWYYFDASGKMYHKNNLKTINGKKFLFNEHGQMVYEWINKDTTLTHSSNAQLDGNLGTRAGLEDIANMVWFKENGDGADNGSRYKGWQYISGSEDVGTEGDTNWYYFKDGKAKYADKANGLKDIDTTKKDRNIYRKKEKLSWDGKSGTFCFDKNGKMKTGLQWIEGHTYFFNNDGYMQTGKVSDVEEEDGSFNYYFSTKNSNKGQGYTGEKDGYLYFNGKRLEADDDYKIFFVNGKYYVVNNKGKLQKSLKNKTLELPTGGSLENAALVAGENDDNEIIKNSYVISGNTVKEKVDGKFVESTEWTVRKIACVPHIQLEDVSTYILPKEFVQSGVQYAEPDQKMKDADYLTVAMVKNATKYFSVDQPKDNKDADENADD